MTVSRKRNASHVLPKTEGSLIVKAGPGVHERHIRPLGGTVVMALLSCDVPF